MTTKFTNRRLNYVKLNTAPARTMLSKKGDLPFSFGKCLTNNPSGAAFKFASIFFTFYLLASLIYYPSILVNGRIWAEEAREFLIPLASTSQPLDIIFYLHKGHLDLFPNIATYFSLILPIQLTPYIFVWVSLIPIACFSICFGCYLYRFAFLRLGAEAFKKAKLLQFFWISGLGFLASSCFIGVESHMNTLNSWTFIVASVALLVPITQTPNAPFFATIFISISPILAFPSVLFSPWLFLQLIFSRSSRIKAQNIFFFISCAIQVALPRMLQSNWSFGDDRCFQMRDIIAVIPSLLIKNITPLIGNIHGFDRQSNSAWQNHSILTFSSIICLIFCGLLIYTYSKNTNLRYLFSEYSFHGDKSLAIAIGSTSILILSWQISAIASSGNGAYAQLMLGGGYRYTNSIFLVFLAIISIVFLSSTSINTVSAHLIGKSDSWRVRKLNVDQVNTIQALSIGWLALMLTLSISLQNKRHLSDDFWCFFSRPEWLYQDHNEFIAASQDPKSIFTCPRGWDNTMQGQKKKNKEGKKEFCSQQY